MKYLLTLLISLFAVTNIAYAVENTDAKEKPKMKLAKKKADIDKEKAEKKAAQQANKSKK